MAAIICNDINFKQNKGTKKNLKKYSFVKSEKDLETKVHKISKNILNKCIKENSNYKKRSRVQTWPKRELYYNNRKSTNDYTKINFYNVTCNLIIIILFIFCKIPNVYSFILIDLYSSIITIRINESGTQNIFF